MVITQTPSKSKKTFNNLPDKQVLNIFSYVHHRQLLRCARVCKKWRTLAYDPRLWSNVCLRPDHGGLRVVSYNELLALISVRFGPCLKFMELPMDLISPPIFNELANKCPQLQSLTLDFGGASQLQDFSDLIAFPARLRTFTICLSEVIFLEGFVKRIYTFISSVQVFNVIGTYEKIEDEEEEAYEVLNIHKLKAHLPNLTVINLFGVTYVNDEHVESITSGTTHLVCLAVNFCSRVTGSCLKNLFTRCKYLKTLLMEQCLLKSKDVIQASWESTQIEELNITATDLNTECLKSILLRLPHLRWLSAGFLEDFTDDVLEQWIESGNCRNIKSLNIDTSDSLSEHSILDFISFYGEQLEGLNLGGQPPLVEAFWCVCLPQLRNIRILIAGIAEDCCPKVTARIHIDQFLSDVSEHCTKIERLEMRWDPERLRFSEKSAKFVDFLRLKCLQLKSFVLADGPYFELVRSNFERTGRMSVVRNVESCKTSLVNILTIYNDLMFN